MRIVVLGAGALGSLLAGLLSRQNEVYMVGRKEHVHEVNESGLRIEGLNEGAYAPVAGERLDESPFYPNWILLTVKAYQTEDAAKDILETFPKVPVLSFQNGIENEEALIGMGLDAVGGVTSHGITFLGPGNIRHAGEGRTVIGEMDDRISMRVRAMAYVLSEAGILTEVSDNIKGEIWLKGAVNSVINPLTALLGVKNGFLLENEDLKDLGDRIAGECETVARLESISLPRSPIDAWKEVAEMTAENVSSALQDIRNGKRTEIKEINGVFVRKAEEHGVDAPYNRAILNLVSARESLL